MEIAICDNPITGQPVNTHLSVYCFLSFGRCVASLVLRWWNCTCVISFPPSHFRQACTVPPPQCQKLSSVQKIKSNKQNGEYWFPCDST